LALARLSCRPLQIFYTTGEDGADHEIKPKEKIPVAIGLCWFGAIESCVLPIDDQTRDLKVGIIKKERGTETNGDATHQRRHDTLITKIRTEAE